MKEGSEIGWLTRALFRKEVLLNQKSKRAMADEETSVEGRIRVPRYLVDEQGTDSGIG